VIATTIGAGRSPVTSVTEGRLRDVPAIGVFVDVRDWGVEPGDGLDGAWTPLFRVHSRIADRYRVGAAFLVGDAAHIHSPAGGQGMNLGIGDAVNVGWKLGLVAAGRAPEQLLDSYEIERRPVARSVLQFSDRGFALETATNPVATWIRTHVGMRLIGPLTLLPVVRRAVFAMFAQTWIGYRRSPIVTGHRGAVVRAGDRLPHPSADELDAVRHTLLLIRPPGERPGDPSGVGDVTRRFRVPVAVRDVPADERFTPTPRGLVVLVGPDGHVGYLGDPGDSSPLESCPTSARSHEKRPDSQSLCGPLVSDRPQARRAASRSRMNSPTRPPPGGAAGRRPSTAVAAVGA